MKGSTVSARGQLVIPHEFRDKYGIKKNTKVEWIDTGNGLMLIPVSDNPIKDTRGILKEGTSLTKALLKQRKEERQQEEKKIKEHK